NTRSYLSLPFLFDFIHTMLVLIHILFPYTTLFRSPLSLSFFPFSLSLSFFAFFLSFYTSISLHLSLSRFLSSKSNKNYEDFEVSNWKRTRLYSSHVSISYVVFFVKKNNISILHETV